MRTVHFLLNASHEDPRGVCSSWSRAPCPTPDPMDHFHTHPILVECSLVEKEVHHMSLFAYLRTRGWAALFQAGGVAFPTTMRKFYAGIHSLDTGL